MKIRCINDGGAPEFYKVGKIYDFVTGVGIELEDGDFLGKNTNVEVFMKCNNADWEIVETDQVNHPTHYNVHQMECIEEMIVAFGVEATINFCVLNAWKYRYRAGAKGCEEQDLEKSDWYMNKAKELRERKHDNY